MNPGSFSISRRRFSLHLIFWATWVFGFTFIKSFGETMAVYLGWLIYYIVTLPVFLCHTYLIVYWMIPAFILKRRYFLFSIIFIALFYGFSMLELIISNEFVFNYFQTGTAVTPGYLKPGNVLVSGLGNLYIVLVFMAARSVRAWYLNQEKQKQIHRQKLALQLDNAISRVQPRLLLFAVDQIERLAEKSPDMATKAIAFTSEMLNKVMMYEGKKLHGIEKEVELIKKLIDLMEVLGGTRPEVEFFVSGDPSKIQFPSLILFTFVEMVFRQFYHTGIPEIHLDISEYSNMATIQVLLDHTPHSMREIKECEELLLHFEKIYPGFISVSVDHSRYGCVVIITNQASSKNAMEGAAAKSN